MTELYNVGNPINRVERNNLNATFQDIRNEVARTMYRIDYFANEINGVQSQLNNIVVTGDSSVEAAQARVGYDNTVYSTLKERLDTEIIEALNGGGGGGLTKATTAQAVEGTDDEAYMTPLKVNDVTGTIANLETTDKSSLVGAINELFTDVDNGKGLVADAITDKGVPATATDTFQQLADKIELLPTGLKYYKGNVYSSPSTRSFANIGGQYISRASLIVSTLTFRPRIIIIHPYSGSINVEIYTYLMTYGDLGQVYIQSYIPNGSTSTSITTFAPQTSPAYVNETGFTLPVSSTNTRYEYEVYG